MDFIHAYPQAVSVSFTLVPYSARTFDYEGDRLRWADPDVDAAATALRSVRQQWRDTRRLHEPLGATA
jgi:hypothetical protein